MYFKDSKGFPSDFLWGSVGSLSSRRRLGIVMVREFPTGINLYVSLGKFSKEQQ